MKLYLERRNKIFSFMVSLVIIQVNAMLITTIANAALAEYQKVTLEDAIYSLQVVSGVVSHNTWVKYDDFENNTIDPLKWSTGCKSGAVGQIGVVNGRLKIDYMSNDANTYCYAEANINALDARVKAVKLKMTVDSSSNDSRGRVRGDRVTNEFDYYDSINLFGALRKIECYTEKTRLSNYESVDNANLQFNNPLDITGNTFNVILWFLPNKSVFEVENIGIIITSTTENKSTDVIFPFVLDVKSSSGAGTAVVYFDDVYVLYDN